MDSEPSSAREGKLSTVSTRLYLVGGSPWHLCLRCKEIVGVSLVVAVIVPGLVGSLGGLGVLRRRMSRYGEDSGRRSCGDEREEYRRM